MKDYTGQVQIQVPTRVANFLLNEKRKALNDIETRHDVPVLVLANEHMQRPKFEIERVRKSEVSDEASYTHVKKPEEVDLGVPATRPAVRKDVPAVTAVSQARPAPPVKEPVVEVEKKQPGFLGRIFGSLFASPETATVKPKAVLQKPKPTGKAEAAPSQVTATESSAQAAPASRSQNNRSAGSDDGTPQRKKATRKRAPRKKSAKKKRVSKVSAQKAREQQNQDTADQPITQQTDDASKSASTEDQPKRRSRRRRSRYKTGSEKSHDNNASNQDNNQQDSKQNDSTRNAVKSSQDSDRDGNVKEPRSEEAMVAVADKPSSRSNGQSHPLDQASKPQQSPASEPSPVPVPKPPASPSARPDSVQSSSQPKDSVQTDNHQVTGQPSGQPGKPAVAAAEPARPAAAPAKPETAPTAVVERDSKGIYTLKPADSAAAKPAPKSSVNEAASAD